MRQSFNKLLPAIDYAKEESKSSQYKGKLILVVKTKSSGYVVIDKEELDPDDELECTYLNGLKSIWQEKHISYMRRAREEETAVCE